MSYKVYFGPLTLYGAEKVDVALARPVTVHNLSLIHISEPTRP